MWIAAISILFLFLGALAVISNSDFVYFVSAIGAFILALLALGFAAMVLRQWRQAQASPKWDSTETQDNSVIHMDDLSSWCPKKYVKNCRKQDATAIWENGTHDPAFINPACGCSAKQYILWPYFCLGVFAGFLALSLIGSSSANTFLFDYSPQRRHSASVQEGRFIPAIVALLVSLLVVLALGVYFAFFRNGHEVRMNRQQQAFYNPKKYPLEGFDVVKRWILYENQVARETPNAVYNLKKNPNGLFKSDSHCKSANPKDCQFRLAVLGDNVKIYFHAKYVKRGAKETRLFVFPGCTDSSRDYAMIWGGMLDIQAALRTLEFAVEDISKPASAFVKLTQVAADDIHSDGRISPEKEVGTLKDLPD